MSEFLWSVVCGQHHHYILYISREAQAVAKGLTIEDGEDIPPAEKRKQILKRIREWERFEANCHMLKELEREKKKLKKQLEEKKRRRNSLGHQMTQGNKRSQELAEPQHSLRKAQSIADPLSPVEDDRM